MTDAADRLRLARTPGVGPVTYRRLLRRFGSAAAALDGLPQVSREAGRDNPPRIPSRGDAQRELDRLAKLGGTMLFLDDPAYPPLLALMNVAPPALAVLGDAAALSARAVAVVGARNASAAGRRMAEMLASDLAASGLVVVSGMARGIDAAAHEGAMRTGRTVAVLGGGIDVAYPPENEALQRMAAENGAVVAEAPLGTAPMAQHFPRRNRIIAGLSLGVVVVEATPHSGSLHTANLAQDLGREVYAVPGSPLDPRCQGSNDLLRKGATLTEHARDVLSHLPEFASSLPLAAGMSEQSGPYGGGPDPAVVRTRVLSLLGFTPTPVDDLVRRCQFSAASVNAALSDLELAGRAELLPGHRVCLAADEA